ncbi:hypothetical protein ACA910_022616 [Epithemia clementina (nom. ined.)]
MNGRVEPTLYTHMAGMSGSLEVDGKKPPLFLSIAEGQAVGMWTLVIYRDYDDSWLDTFRTLYGGTQDFERVIAKYPDYRSPICQDGRREVV